MCEKVFGRLMVMNAKVLYLIAIASILSYAIALGYFYFEILQGKSEVGGPSDVVSGLEGFKMFFLATLIAPLVETFVFQYVIIMGILRFRYFRVRLYIPILISALAFSVSHTYSLYYMVYAFGMGLIFALFFVIFMKRNELPFLNTLLLHSIFNFLVFIAKIYDI